MLTEEVRDNINGFNIFFLTNKQNIFKKRINQSSEFFEKTKLEYNIKTSMIDTIKFAR